MGNASSTPVVDPADAEVRALTPLDGVNARVSNGGSPASAPRDAAPPSDPSSAHPRFPSIRPVEELLPRPPAELRHRVRGCEARGRPGCRARGVRVQVPVRAARRRPAVVAPLVARRWARGRACTCRARRPAVRSTAARGRSTSFTCGRRATAGASPRRASGSGCATGSGRLLEDGDAVGLVGAVEDDPDDAPPVAGAGTSATTVPPAAPVGGVQVERGSVKVSVRMRPQGVGGAARADGEGADEGRGGAAAAPAAAHHQGAAGRGVHDERRDAYADAGQRAGSGGLRSPWADAEVSDSDGGSVAVPKQCAKPEEPRSRRVAIPARAEGRDQRRKRVRRPAARSDERFGER